jgi:hypothetical protein
MDDGFFHNRKARAVGPEGRELFLAAGCYCSNPNQLNDGCFVAEDLPVIAALAQVQPTVADRLYAQELWHPEGTDCAKCRAVGQTMPVPAGHIAIHEYLAHNPTREKVIADRAAAAERQRKSREKSQRDSRRDSERSNGVSSAAPVPLPTDDYSSRRPSNSRGRPQPVDNPDDDGFFAAVWDRYAQLKLERQTPGKVKDPAPWKRKTADNARIELSDKALRWHDEFDINPSQLAAALIEDKAPAAHYRRKDSA